MSQLTTRLRALAASVTFSESEQQDIRNVAKLYELAEKWDTTADVGRSEALCNLRSHLKVMRAQP